MVVWQKWAIYWEVARSRIYVCPFVILPIHKSCVHIIVVFLLLYMWILQVFYCSHLCLSIEILMRIFITRCVFFFSALVFLYVKLPHVSLSHLCQCFICLFIFFFRSVVFLYHIEFGALHLSRQIDINYTDWPVYFEMSNL